MTRYEKISIFLSVTALCLSLPAGGIGAYLTYKWFDPAVKELEQRGVLQQIGGSQSVVCIGATRSPDHPMSYETQLKNIGRRPMKDIEISISQLDNETLRPTISIDGFVVDEPRIGTNTTTFRLSTAIAPGEKIKLAISGIYSSIIVRPQTIDPIITLVSEQLTRHPCGSTPDSIIDGSMYSHQLGRTVLKKK